MAKRRRGGFGNFESDFGEFTDAFRKSTHKTLKQMARLVKKEVKKNTSVVDDHTPDWLKRAGHPYAGRPPLPHRVAKVHKVSGNLTENVEVFQGARRGEVRVGVLQRKVPYVGYIVHGTAKMISRDFLSYSLLSVKKKLKKIMIKNYKKTMKKQTKK